MKITKEQYDEINNKIDTLTKSLNGGKGSGNFGHAGRPGEIGGSSSRGGGSSKGEAKKEKEKIIKQSKKTQESLGGWAEKNLDYPEDYKAKELSTDEIISRMASGEDFYEIVGQIDSVDREKVFGEMSKRLGVEYGDVYDTWLGDKPANIREYAESLKQSPRLRELATKAKEGLSHWKKTGETDQFLSGKEKDERSLRDMVHSTWTYGDDKDSEYLQKGQNRHTGEERYPNLTEKERKKIVDEEWDYCDKNLASGYAGTDSEGVSYNYEMYAPSKARGRKKNSLEKTITEAIFRTLNSDKRSGNFGSQKEGQNKK